MKWVPVISAVTATRIQEKASIIFLFKCVLVTGVSKELLLSLKDNMKNFLLNLHFWGEENDNLKRIDVYVFYKSQGQRYSGKVLVL